MTHNSDPHISNKASRRGPLKTFLAWLIIPGRAQIPPIVWLLLLAASVARTLPTDDGPLQHPTVIERLVIVTATPVAGNQSRRAKATLTPTPASPTSILALTVRHNGNSDIYLLPQGTGELMRLTFAPEDDRDPAWSPDGSYLAFASRRAGAWDIYLMEMSTGTILRVTRTPGFEGGPAWSPDGQWLVYEAYRDENLDLYIRNMATDEEHRLTYDPAPDYSPAWSPDGRYIAFTSYRDGNQDIYVLSLDEGTTVNLTHTPDLNEDAAAWSPSGEYLAYASGVPGSEMIWEVPFDIDALSRGQVRPFLFGVGSQPTWSPNGDALAFIVRRGSESFLIAADVQGWALAHGGFSTTDNISDPAWRASDLDPALRQILVARTETEEAPLYTELLLSPSGDHHSALVWLPDVNGSDHAQRLSDQVNDSFNALRRRVLAETGWDYLGQLGDSWRPMDHTPRPGQGRISWHVCGRAIDIDQSFWRSGLLELVREDLGGVTYWRVYIKAKKQDGSLGEPLRQAPWDLNARARGGVAAAEGGAFKTTVPSGYYVDFTTLAADYGWERRNALSNWRTSYYDVEWWHFQKTDGMSWYDCMLELYDEEEILASYGSLPWWTKRPEQETPASLVPWADVKP